MFFVVVVSVSIVAIVIPIATKTDFNAIGYLKPIDIKLPAKLTVLPRLFIR